MANRDIVVIGASAGGVEALTGLMRTLPGDLPASVFIVHDQEEERTGSIASLESRARETETYAGRLRQFLLALHQE